MVFVKMAVDWYHTHVKTTAPASECIRWCETNLGPRLYYLHTRQGGETWWYSPNGKFSFKHEQDLILFLLRWS